MPAKKKKETPYSFLQFFSSSPYRLTPIGELSDDPRLSRNDEVIEDPRVMRIGEELIVMVVMAVLVILESSVVRKLLLRLLRSRHRLLTVSNSAFQLSMLSVSSGSWSSLLRSGI